MSTCLSFAVRPTEMNNSCCTTSVVENGTFKNNYLANFKHPLLTYFPSLWKDNPKTSGGFRSPKMRGRGFSHIPHNRFETCRYAHDYRAGKVETQGADTCCVSRVAKAFSMSPTCCWSCHATLSNSSFKVLTPVSLCTNLISSLFS